MSHGLKPAKQRTDSKSAKGFLSLDPHQTSTTQNNLKLLYQALFCHDQENGKFFGKIDVIEKTMVNAEIEFGGISVYSDDFIIDDVKKKINVTLKAKKTSIILGESVSIQVDPHNSSYRFEWDFGDGTISDELLPEHRYDSGVFEISLSVVNGICSDKMIKSINTYPIKTYNVFSPSTSIGLNDFFVVESPLPVHVTIVNRWGKVVYEAEEYRNDWNANEEPAGVYYYDISINLCYILSQHLNSIDH
mgnify:CR=1 FL=1